MAEGLEVPTLPEVAHLKRLSMPFRVRVGRGSVPPNLKTDRRYLWAYVHLIRVVDKSVREYNAARADLRTFRTLHADRTSYTVEEASTMEPYLLWALDHMESCVDALHRAVETATLLRKERIGLQAPKPNQESVRRLKNIRDAMQHTPERLIATSLKPGRNPFGPKDPYGIAMKKDHLAIGAEEPLAFTELIHLMETCHHGAEIIGSGQVHAP